ncbi:F-box protein At5g07610-like [Tasmannia lanceolata]|uniref:F-box protein At5g07610-like n=1 Tax=Tasmannia lanceolata TaxID=3420 RepID=UPI00406336C5
MKKQKINRSELIDTSSSSTFGDDLVMEIFSRLPAKSLFRFKCVSKARCDLISNDFFQKSLLLNRSGLFYRTSPIYPTAQYELREPVFAQISDDKARYDSISDMSLSFLPFYPNFRIIDCCNGLILCLCRETYYVCNPVTKEWVSLPKLHKRAFCVDANLAYDPVVSPHYKVVCLREGRNQLNNNNISLEIFFSLSGKWVESKMLIRNVTSRGAVFLNGILHMIPLDFSHYHIVGINLKEDNCQRIELPESENFLGLLGKCRGSLHYAIHDKSRIRIWMLKDCHSNEWVLKHETSIQTLVEKLTQPIYLHKPLCVFPFRPVAFHPQFELIFLASCCKMYSYHLDNSRLEEICSVDSEKDSNSCQRFNIFPLQAMPELLEEGHKMIQ